LLGGTEDEECNANSAISSSVSISKSASTNSSSMKGNVGGSGHSADTAVSSNIVERELIRGGSKSSMKESRSGLGLGLDEKGDLSVAAIAGGSSALLQRRRSNSINRNQLPAAQQQTFPSDLQPLSLTRVVSLGAFESPPIYDTTKSERQTTRLRRDQRKIAVNTSDFQELRLTFAFEAVQALIAKETKAMMKETKS